MRKSSFKDKENNFEYKIITLNNENNYKINQNKLNKINTDKKIDTKYLLKKGNIILKLTPPYNSRIIEFNENNITTTSNYAIIKVCENYSPEIINFYLNSEYIKKQIYQFADERSACEYLAYQRMDDIDVWVNADNKQLAGARLYLADCTLQVIKNAMKLVLVPYLEKM